MPPSDSGDSNGESSFFLGSQSSGFLGAVLPHAARPQDCVPGSLVTSQNRSRMKSPKNPPRPPNSYMVFLSELRNTHASSKITTSLAGKLWRELSPEKKQIYYARSVAAKRQHALQYPGYALQPKKGSDRRAYGSRKPSAQRGSKSTDAVGISFSHAEGAVEVAASEFHSHSGHQEPQPHIQLSMVYPSYDTFDISSLSSSPQAVDAVLGLYGVPGPTPQSPFPLPPTPIDLPLVPIRIPGVNSLPSHSPYSTSPCFFIQTPSTFYNTPFTPCLTSMDSQLQCPSPLLYFEQLSLDDQVTNHTFTPNLPPAPALRPVLLPEVRTPDYDLFSFPDFPNHPQGEFATGPENPIIAHNSESVGAVFEPRG